VQGFEHCADGKLPLGLLSRCRDLSPDGGTSPQSARHAPGILARRCAVTERARRSRFASRPSDGEPRIKSSEASALALVKSGAFAARLTIDVASEPRARVKVAAFQRGVTATDMLRDLLVKAFPAVDGGTP
jgi:hypothetical protein